MLRHSALTRKLAPDYFEYRRVQVMLIASRELKYLYVLNPKVASTTVRNRLHELNGYPPLENPVDVMGHKGSGFWLPRHMSDAELEEVCRTGDYFRFSFVRNPFDRLVSGYTYFQKGIRNRDLLARRERLLLRRLDPKQDYKTRTLLDFPAFVRAVCTERTYVQDQHWRRQVDILKVDLIDYDFIGKMETFTSDMLSVLERLNASDEIKARVDQKTNKSSRTMTTAALYDTTTADLVRTAFARDFSTFGYSLDLPD
jgi:hypothetical protein